MTDSRRITNVLLLCGAAGGPLFVAVFTAEGATREAYSALRDPVSALALGNRGWVQRSNFIGTGGLMLACAGGLRRAIPDAKWAPRFVAAFAVGLVGAGVFVTDPPAPAADEQAAVAPNVQGALHNAFSMVVFGALAAACGAMAQRFARSGQGPWAVYSAVTGFAIVGGVGMFGRAFSGARYVRVGGGIQRLTIVVGWGWLSTLATSLLRNNRRRAKTLRSVSDPATRSASGEGRFPNRP